MRKKAYPPFFAPYSRSTQNGKQGRCGHTCYFCWAAGSAKMLVGELPKPAGLRDKVSQSPGAYAYCLRPGLSLRSLIFPPVRVAEQMVNVRLDRHGLPHIRLGLAVLCIKGLFLFRQLPAGLFHIRYFGKFLPV